MQLARAVHVQIGGPKCKYYFIIIIILFLEISNSMIQIGPHQLDCIWAVNHFWQLKVAFSAGELVILRGHIPIEIEISLEEVS